MEEPFSSSLHICQFIVDNTLISKAAGKLPPSRTQLRLYSTKKSEHIADMILKINKHPYDSPANRLSEDLQILNSNKARNCLNKSLTPKEIGYNHEKKDSVQTDLHQSSWDSSEVGLVPLTHLQTQSDEDTQEDDIETRMRDVKMHQENVRTRILENFKFGKTKKASTQYKTEGKTIPKIGVYDYDGSLIQPLKGDSIRYQGHFQDIEVLVDSKEQKASLPKTIKKKGAKNVRFECSSKNKEELKSTESVFLKELGKIQWVDGVEVVSNKEECRKILGYHQNCNLKSKRIDFSKPNQAPRHIKFEDLQNCRGLLRAESSLSIGFPSQQHLHNSQVIKKEDLPQTQGPRTIKIANNRALQFLMNEAPEETSIPTKKSGFVQSKKTFKSFYS